MYRHRYSKVNGTQPYSVHLAYIHLLLIYSCYNDYCLVVLVTLLGHFSCITFLVSFPISTLIVDSHETNRTLTDYRALVPLPSRDFFFTTTLGIKGYP